VFPLGSDGADQRAAAACAPPARRRGAPLEDEGCADPATSHDTSLIAVAMETVGLETDIQENMRRAAKPWVNVLGDNRLSGVLDADIRLRPLRPLRLVPTGDPDAFLSEVTSASEAWGGGGHPIIAPDSHGLSDQLISDIERADIDSIGGDTPVALPSRPRRLPLGAPRGFPVAAVLSSGDRDTYATVVIPRLARDDPWYLIYAAHYGHWPETLSERLVRFYDARADLRYEEVIPVRVEEVQGSVSDVLARQHGREISPREASMTGLSWGMGLATGLFGPQEVLPNEPYTRRAAGPNVIVACSQDSVEDAALLWSLRAAHGNSYDFPMGLPASELSADVLTRIAREGRRAHFGWAGGHLYLTSHSVDIGTLEALVAGVRHGLKVAAPYELFDLGVAPGRWSQRVLTFEEGKTLIAPGTEEDREFIRSISLFFRKPGLCLDMSVIGEALPRDSTLRGSSYGYRFPAGRAQLRVDGDLTTQPAVWPTGWTVAQALATTRGLDISVSDAGRAAMALVEAVGGMSGVSWLKDMKLIDLLRRMSESGGASVTRARLARHLESRALADDVVASEHLVTAPAGEGRSMRFADFARILGSPGATAWLRWAEEHRLVVRGTVVRCHYCGAEDWFAIGNLSSTLICTGCTRPLQNAFAME
jgi:hypothetical protein